MIFRGSFLIGNKTSQPHRINHTCPVSACDRRDRTFTAHVSRSDLLKINGSCLQLQMQHPVNAYS